MDKSRRIIFERTEDFPQLVYDYIKGRVSAQDVVSQSMVDDIIENSNRVKSIFKMKMDFNELGDNFDLEEGDEWYLYSFLQGGTMEFESEDTIEDGFLDGQYFLGDLFDKTSDEYQMSLNLYRQFDENFSINNPEVINNTFFEGYKREIGEIFDLVYEYQNEVFDEKMREVMSEELQRVLGPYGMEIDLVEGYSDFYNVSIPAGNLYYLMKMNPGQGEQGYSDLDSIHFAMRGMVRNIPIGGWNDTKWDLDVSDFKTNPNYVSETNRIMADLLEAVDEEMTSEETALLTNIFGDFGVKRFNDVPDKKLRFTINYYDPKDNSLNIFVERYTDRSYHDLPIRKWHRDTQVVNISLQNFYNWYHHYELNLESRNILLSLRKVLTDDAQ